MRTHKPKRVKPVKVARSKAEEKRPDEVIDGVEVFIHRRDPTPVDERKDDALWREIIGLLLNRRVEHTRKSSSN